MIRKNRFNEIYRPFVSETIHFMQTTKVFMVLSAT